MFHQDALTMRSISHCRETSSSPKARKRGKTSLQSGMSSNDSDMANSGMRLITIEEPQNTILEPLKEVSETNLETPASTESEAKTSFANVPVIDIHSPTRFEGRTRKKPVPEMTSPPAIRRDVSPVTSASSPPAPAEPPVAASTPDPVLSKEQEQPELRKMSEEKKRARRIRTNSRVETVL